MSYVLRRGLHAAIVVWAAFTLSFILLYALPGDPIAIMLGGEGAGAASAAQRHALAAAYGYDQSTLARYFQLLNQAAHGDFGVSMQSGKPVATLILEALPETLKLAGVALLLAVTVGFALALAASARPSGKLRAILLALPPIAMAIPSFWTGLILLHIFAFRLHWLPAIGNQGGRSLILPGITIAIPAAAVIAQTLARSLDETFAQPFVSALKAKGLSFIRLYAVHVLHNAILPTLTVIGVIMGHVFSGAVVTETVFSRSGAGRLLQSAVSVQDIPVVQGLVVLAAVAFALINLAVDLSYPLLDPRMRRVRDVAAQAG